MRKFLALAASAAVLACVSAPSRADPIDMSTITCANMTSMKQEEVEFVLIWVQGYLAGTEEETSMDPAALGKSVADTVAYCQENTEMSVLNATREVSAK